VFYLFKSITPRRAFYYPQISVVVCRKHRINNRVQNARAGVANDNQILSCFAKISGVFAGSANILCFLVVQFVVLKSFWLAITSFVGVFFRNLQFSPNYLFVRSATTGDNTFFCLTPKFRNLSLTNNFSRTYRNQYQNT
jgi:hypothetical protein